MRRRTAGKCGPGPALFRDRRGGGGGPSDEVMPCYAGMWSAAGGRGGSTATVNCPFAVIVCASTQPVKGSRPAQHLRK